MSEPSQEAKQAARDWRRDTLTQLGEREAYAEGYDTATAKARADNEQLSQALQCCKAELVLARAALTGTGEKECPR